ncbi:hypothetical protein L228DRAFT_268234 [Xylona heveae TC161]|uniref:Uncharacterized protein n=1 Tax=Xylona heveae (strain CBS 132557 / TC161) TaxID=1328760 RepID=A0A165H113_XYLHT|nr:hypothetical protein L228DRAFT_268234 [Xylona heveae TC161]KZF22853.1 hypothetical protein L228DRAFT_268234 [Xylona heveae TC161]
MNRFKTRRKAKAEPPGNLGIPDSAENPSTHSLNPLKKSKKKQQPPARPEIDLSNVLPSNDTFRTSLIMPKLSARFSMLRDQDDPLSLVGKANDDSVLDVKRQSRLLDYGFLRRDLSIISEVTSSGSLRAPFEAGQHESSISGESYGTEEESRNQGGVLNRSRPFESNNMFGGRQKAFKVMTSDLDESQSSGQKPPRGGALYEADVPTASFHGPKEMPLAESVSPQPSNREELTDVDHKEDMFERSSAISNKRTTSSSTNSGPSVTRTSTVASSVGSQIAALEASIAAASTSTAKPSKEPAGTSAQNVDRTPARPKRLYERGLDQHLHDQQSSALNRLDTIHRLRSRPPPLDIKQSKPRSASNPPDSLGRPKQMAVVPNRKEGSLPPSPAPGFDGFDFRFESLESKDSKPDLASAPLSSPTINRMEEPLPSPAAVSTASNGRRGSAATVSTHGGSQSSRRPSDANGVEKPLLRSKASPLVDKFQPSESKSRSSEEVENRNQSAGPRPNHVQAYGVFHRAAEKFKSDASTPNVQRENEAEGTFFANFSESESEHSNDWHVRSRNRGGSEDDPRPAPLRPSNAKVRRPSKETNGPKYPKLYTYSEQDMSPVSTTFPAFITGHQDQIHRSGNMPSNFNEDSPTLGPVSGLNGLIRQHLRMDSYQSSLNLAVDADASTAGIDFPEPLTPSETDDDRSGRLAGQRKGSQNSHDAAASPIGWPSSNTMDDSQSRLRQDAPKFAPWEEEARGRHARGGSTETQVERAEFANELAQRRRMIEQNVRAFTETDIRSASRAESTIPAHPLRDPPPKPSNPFGLLKSKSSKSSLSGKQEGSNKLSKVRLPNSNGLRSRQSEEELRRQLEEEILREIIRGPKIPGVQSKVWPREHQAIGRENEATHYSVRHASDPERPPSRSHQRTASRDRSVSEASAGRSRSRSRSRQREAPRHTVMEAFDSVFGETPAAGFSRPSPDMSGSMNSEHSSIASPSRFRSNSNSPALPNYFERPGVRPNHSRPASPAIGLSSHPSPAMPISGNSTPPLHDGVPISQNSPPNGPIFYGEQPLTRTYRKKPIQKSDISEPTFVSSTSSVTTIDLPQGASLRNHDGEGTSPPPVPPINPRRKRGTATQSFLGAFGGRNDKTEPAPAPQPSPVPQSAVSPLQPVEEQSSWSDDEDSPKRKPRHRLRKSISEGTSLRIRAKQQSVVVPNTPPLPRSPIPPATAEGHPF